MYKYQVTSSHMKHVHDIVKRNSTVSITIKVVSVQFSVLAHAKHTTERMILQCRMSSTTKSCIHCNTAENRRHQHKHRHTNTPMATHTTRPLKLSSHEIDAHEKVVSDTRRRFKIALFHGHVLVLCLGRVHVRDPVLHADRYPGHSALVSRQQVGHRDSNCRAECSSECCCREC